MTKNWTRRDLLKGALALGGGLYGVQALHSLVTPAWASDNDPLLSRNFIFCYFSGGWDILLGLDPRDPARFRDDNRGETLIQPAYDQLAEANKEPIESQLVPDMWFGPYIGKLADYADRMAIIRGMSMDTLTHQAGRRRFLTGRPPSGIQARGSSMSSIIAGQIGPTSPIPNLSGGVESFNVDQPNYASALTVASVTDLLRALREGSVTLDSLEDEHVSAILNEFQNCRRETRSRQRTLAHESRLAAADLVKSNLDKFFDFSSPDMEETRARYGIGSSLNTPNSAAAMAVSAITNGISRCVSVQVASGLDTHYDDWTEDQGPRQQAGFDLVAAMVEPNIGT